MSTLPARHKEHHHDHCSENYGAREVDLRNRPHHHRALLAQAPRSAQTAQDTQPTQRDDPQQPAQVQDDVRNTLSQYGRFVQHQKYGEVWVPTVTPQGWHPYPPCNWVNSKQYGWYYDDKTPWGQIVHHYGRWVYDAQMGWIWTPGLEFSPGWVVWRTSPEWVGWAPMLPDQDVQKISAADFNNAGYWIFVETKKFAQGCNGASRRRRRYRCC